jgi:hypothetical protein
MDYELAKQSKDAGFPEEFRRGCRDLQGFLPEMPAALSLLKFKPRNLVFGDAANTLSKRSQKPKSI